MTTDISTGDLQAALDEKGTVIDFKKAREKRDADLLETADLEDGSFQKFAINLRPVNDEEEPATPT